MGHFPQGGDPLLVTVVPTPDVVAEPPQIAVAVLFKPDALALLLLMAVAVLFPSPSAKALLLLMAVAVLLFAAFALAKLPFTAIALSPVTPPDWPAKAVLPLPTAMALLPAVEVAVPAP